MIHTLLLIANGGKIWSGAEIRRRRQVLLAIVELLKGTKNGTLA